MNVLAGSVRVEVGDDIAHQLIKDYAIGIKDAEREWRSGRPILLGGENRAEMFSRINKLTDPIKDYHSALGATLQETITAMRAEGMSNAAVAQYLRDNVPDLIQNTPVTINRPGREAVTFTPSEYSEMVARTIPHQLRNAGYVDHIKAIGVSDGWIWDASMDERTCDYCWQNHGEEFSFDDPTPPEASHVGCRCRPRANPKPEEEIEELPDEPIGIPLPPAASSEVEAELNFMSSLVAADPYYPSLDPAGGLVSLPSGVPVPALNELALGVAVAQRTAQEIGLPLFRGMAPVEEEIGVGRGILRVDGGMVGAIWQGSARGQAADLALEKRALEARLRSAEANEAEKIAASLAGIDRQLASVQDPPVSRWTLGADLSGRPESVLEYLPPTSRIAGAVNRELGYHALYYFGVRGNARMAANPPLLRAVERIFAGSPKIQLATLSVTPADWFADNFVLFQAGLAGLIDPDLRPVLQAVALGESLPI